MVDVRAQREGEDDLEWTKRDVKATASALASKARVASGQAFERAKVEGGELASKGRVVAARVSSKAYGVDKRGWDSGSRPSLSNGFKSYARRQVVSPRVRVVERAPVVREFIGGSASERVINPRGGRVGPQSAGGSDNLPQFYGATEDWRVATSARLFGGFGPTVSPIERFRSEGLPRFFDSKSPRKRRCVCDGGLPRYFG